MSHPVGRIHRILHGLDIGHGKSESVKEVMQLLVVQTHVNQSAAFLAYQIGYLVVVVTLVLAAQYQDALYRHALQGIPAAVHVGGLGVVDEVNSVNPPWNVCKALRMVSLLIPAMLADIPAAIEL